MIVGPLCTWERLDGGGDWWWWGGYSARLTLSLKIAAWSTLDSRAGQAGQGQTAGQVLAETQGGEGGGGEETEIITDRQEAEKGTTLTNSRKSRP